MIRDAHDFRAGIHDRGCASSPAAPTPRWCTRSSATTRSTPCGRATCSSTTTSTSPRAASGTCPTCASPCPCSTQDEVVAFVQAFGHHDDIGGAVPGSMPSHATQRLRGGPDGAADPAVGPGRAERGRAEDHDPQLADARLARRRPRRRVLGLPHGRPPARRAVRPLRPRRRSRPASTRSSSRPPRRSAARSSRRSPTARTSGRTTPSTTASTRRRLHTQRITLTKTRRGAALDDRLHRHLAAGEGPDQPLRRLRRRQLPDEVARADPAQPRRHPGADGGARRQRGRRAADRDAVPAARARCSRRSSRRRPTPARSSSCGCSACSPACWPRPSTGGCPPTRRRSATPASTATTPTAEPYLMREVLGGGSGGRYYADGEDTIHVVPDSRNLPTEFTESRFPFVVERLGLAVDSGGPGRYRGGLGYEKHIRMLRDALVHVDRGPLDPVLLGRARRPGRPAVRGDDRPRRAPRARRRGAGRRRAGAGRRGDPDPDHGRRRLGRPADPARTTRSCATCAGARCRSPGRSPTTA